MLTDDQVSELRSRFQILRERTYLYNCSQGALSDAVEAGLNDSARSWRTSPAPWDEWIGHYESLRAEFARFINAEPDEFPTMGHIWLAQQPRGARVQFLDGVNNAVPAECYEQAIDERTSIVPLTHVSFINGFRPDVAAITRIAHDKGALVFLDGYQDCGTRPLDLVFAFWVRLPTVPSIVDRLRD
jgi:selenocysteine lyase/cysteine desulfurase